MKELRKQINLTIKDFVIYEEIAYFSSISKIIGMMFVLALFILFYICFLISGEGLLLVLVFGIPILSYVYSAFSMIPKKASEFYKTSPYLLYPPYLTLTKDSIFLERKSGNSTIRLDQILAIAENNKYFYVHISKSNFVILPKRDLTEDEIQFVKSVRKSLPKKQRRSPNKMKPLQIVTTALITMFITLMVWFLIFYLQGNV